MSKMHEPHPVFEMARIQEEILDSPAWKLDQRLKLFELSLEVFKRNYAQLHEAVQDHLPCDELAMAQAIGDHARIREEQVEITRLLHNFVAAAKSLVDHTRRLYEKLYEPGDLMPDYPQEIRTRFTDDGLVQFVEGLRNYCLHYELPPISSSFSMHIGRAASAFLYLKKTDLIQWSKWKKGKGFLESAPEKVPFADVMHTYYGKVISFHDWFVERQRKVHKEEIAFLETKRAEFRRLHEAEMARGVTIAMPGNLPLEHEAVAIAAYYIWQAEGCPSGQDKIHWSLAIDQLGYMQDASA